MKRHYRVVVFRKDFHPKAWTWAISVGIGGNLVARSNEVFEWKQQAIEAGNCMLQARFINDGCPQL